MGDYELEKELGQGGMATVWRARHAILDTHCAIKILDPAYRADEAARQRFLDEAKIQAKHLDHPNIVKVTNIIATPEHAALVMELVDGPSLERQLPELQKDLAEVKRIMLAVLDAVGYAHKRGIIHRDLKPGNVLLARVGDQWIPKVVDFGIAKVTSTAGAPAQKKSTHVDARMGTLVYMSPEQIRRSKNVTPRSDVFSLGAMLYELVTGKLPFSGDSDYDVMDAIVNGRCDLATVRERDATIAAVVECALKSDPAQRYASCEDMARALRGDEDSVAPPTKSAATATPITASTEPRKRTPIVAAALFALAALVAVIVVATRGGSKRESVAGRDDASAIAGETLSAPDPDAPAVAPADAAIVQVPAPELKPPLNITQGTLEAVGLRWLSISGGSGRKPFRNFDTVRIRVVGWTSDGKTFENTEKEVHVASITPPGLEYVITQGMEEGSKYRIWIPQKFAFDGEPGGPNGDLTYEVELLDITTTLLDSCPGTWDGMDEDKHMIVHISDADAAACGDLSIVGQCTSKLTGCKPDGKTTVARTSCKATNGKVMGDWTGTMTMWCTDAAAVVYVLARESGYYSTWNLTKE